MHKQTCSCFCKKCNSINIIPLKNNFFTGIGKVERVMLQTADNILDTKKRVEFGVHQIVMDVGNLVKLQSRELNSTVNRRLR